MRAESDVATFAGISKRRKARCELPMRAELRWLGVVMWMCVIFSISAIPSLATPFESAYDFTFKKLAHAVEYGILTALLFSALECHIKPKVSAAVTTMAVATVFALSDEWHQTFVPGRKGSLWDIGIDAIGVVAVALWLGSGKKSSRRSSFSIGITGHT